MDRRWHEYQEDIAALFRSLGLSAEVDAVVTGTRATHNVDVWVTFSRYGVEMKWLVECKFWRRAVPKEKVLALQQIAQDLGADKAFLFSEIGFQSGAVKAAQLTNTTLISLSDLRERSGQDLYEAQLAAVVRRINGFAAGPLDLSYYDPSVLSNLSEEDRDLILSAAGAVFMLKLAIPKAMGGQFPIILSRVSGPMIDCRDAAHFIDAVSAVLNDLGVAEGKIRTAAIGRMQRSCSNAGEFVRSVERLLEIAETALFTPPDHCEFEALRLRALDAMKAVGRSADLVRQDADTDLLRETKATMRLLIDGVYLHLTKPTVGADVWNTSKAAITAQISRIDCGERAH